MKKWIYVGAAAWATLFLPVCSDAVVFYSTGDTNFNTTAPTGDLEGSGWQFQGKFNNYLGTPIGPHHFITAKHIGGSVGNTFYYDGTSYTTVAYTNDANTGSDLRLWEIDGTFESYAPLCTGGEAVGDALTVFGRGVDRGDVVTNTVSSGPPGRSISQTVTNGWKWGAYNYTQRWGTNAVSSLSDSYIIAEWDDDGGDYECMLTDKDSGGAVFIKSDGEWKLAGINYAIWPSTFSLNSDGSNSFSAAILDYEGIYFQYGTEWVSSSSQKSAFYASRISYSYDWITNNVTDFDSDVDGLPDWWETSTGETEAEADPDGDGFTNYEEWIADTDPNLESSQLQLGTYTNSASLQFSSSTNREYLVEYCESLTNQNWQTEVDWFAASETQTVQAVTGSASNRFYRVRVKLP